MSLLISSTKFEIGHALFKQHMFLESKGIPFTGFHHPFLFYDEISYKCRVYHDAKGALALEKWKQWKRRPGRIIRAVKEACKPSISANLLEHRFGSGRYSESPLYKVSGLEQERQFDNRLVDFFLGGPRTPGEFGPRFDAFADYLRGNHLGCKWAFLAYLAFLLEPQVYFPILPTRFDALLRFYGIEESISGYVSWERYSILLELADLLRSKLAIYGQASAIEIQSYMWVVSYLIMDKKKMARSRGIAKPDLDAEFRRRLQKAKERARIGLLGEEFVHEQEKERLKQADRADLANRVRMVSLDDDDLGFDILSFDPEGSELHVEVKTTTYSRGDDPGFWLSGNERLLAERDPRWAVYRVWDIEVSPTYENLGNMLLPRDENWEVSPSSWFVRRRR